MRTASTTLDASRRSRRACASASCTERSTARRSAASSRSRSSRELAPVAAPSASTSDRPGEASRPLSSATGASHVSACSSTRSPAAAHASAADAPSAGAGIVRTYSACGTPEAVVRRSATRTLCAAASTPDAGAISSASAALGTTRNAIAAAVKLCSESEASSPEKTSVGDGTTSRLMFEERVELG